MGPPPNDDEERSPASRFGQRVLVNGVAQLTVADAIKIGSLIVAITLIAVNQNNHIENNERAIARIESVLVDQVKRLEHRIDAREAYVERIWVLEGRANELSRLMQDTIDEIRSINADHEAFMNRLSQMQRWTGPSVSPFPTQPMPAPQ